MMHCAGLNLRKNIIYFQYMVSLALQIKAKKLRSTLLFQKYNAIKILTFVLFYELMAKELIYVRLASFTKV